MILNIYTPKPQTAYGAQSGTVSIYTGVTQPETTLDDILECCQDIVSILRSRGFRRETPSRADIMTKLNQILAETVDNRREIERLKSRGTVNGNG